MNQSIPAGNNEIIVSLLFKINGLLIAIRRITKILSVFNALNYFSSQYCKNILIKYATLIIDNFDFHFIIIF